MKRREFFRGVLATLGAAVASRLPLPNLSYVIKPASWQANHVYAAGDVVVDYTGWEDFSILAEDYPISPAVMEMAKDLAWRAEWSLRACFNHTVYPLPQEHIDFIKKTRAVIKSIERHQRKNAKRHRHHKNKAVLHHGPQADTAGADLAPVQHVLPRMPGLTAEDPHGDYQLTEMPALL